VLVDVDQPGELCARQATDRGEALVALSNDEIIAVARYDGRKFCRALGALVLQQSRSSEPPTPRTIGACWAFIDKRIVDNQGPRGEPRVVSTREPFGSVLPYY